MIDIIIPQGNEEDFLVMAKKLSIDKLCFLYHDQPEKKFKAVYGMLYDQKTIQKGKHTGLAVMGPGDNRVIVEKFKPDILYGVERVAFRDHLHQRNSGLNHIICRFARENKVMIAFSFQDIVHGGYKVLGRMMQNVRLCRKYKVTMVLASFATNPYEMRSPHDLKSIGVQLGMHPPEATNALEAVNKRTTERF